MDICPAFLKRAGSHIALSLLLLFSITFLPFNFLHHHAEDEHVAAMLSHHKEEHHCELDDHYCQSSAYQPCEHKAHIQAPLSKCFSCEFHFIKIFDTQTQLHPYAAVRETNTLPGFVPSALREALVLQANKGPPAIPFSQA